MEQKLIVTSSPHIHGTETVSTIMLDVLIALIPATLMGIYFFGYRAALVVLTCVAASVASEYFYNKLMKKHQTVGDLSAVVTGVLLALNLPSTIPLWMAAIGSFFAIVVVKQLYGGIGKNFMNPAMAARCFMIVAWAGAMTTYAEPFMGSGADAISSATPLSVLKGTAEGRIPTLFEAFFGIEAGSIGETSAAMLLLGLIYLLWKRVVTWRIPVVTVVSYALFTYLFGTNLTGNPQWHYTLLSVCSGGVMLGAVFMATDYVTSPTTPLGQIIYAAGIGILSFVIRKFGGYPEGVSFAILLMNVATPLIDRYTKPKKFGFVKQAKSRQVIGKGV